jgi:hypothetical protein
MQIRPATSGRYLARRRYTLEHGFRITGDGTPAVRRSLGAFELDEMTALSPGIDHDRKRTAFALSTHTLRKTLEMEPLLTAGSGG